MEFLQQVLVYLFLGLAVFYLLRKFVLPKSLPSGKKKDTQGCGQDNCGCA